MLLKNLTRKTVLASNLKEAKSFQDKNLGLLLRTNPRSLLFKTRFGIHTFGLKKPIDVVVLNNNLIVVKVATVKPNKLFFWNIKHILVVELPGNIIRQTNTQLGDQLDFLKR
jgi:uncharacterized membrane protein (UPF0127 family)